MSDVLTVVGKYDGIKEKQSGWFEVEVAVPGKNYPLRLATKSNTLLDAVRATAGEIATYHYKETDSQRINPNTGNPYKNRYLEGVEPGATAAAQAASNASNAGGTKEDVDWDAKERRDFRSRAWAVTISAFQHTIKPDENPLDVFARLHPFQRAMYEDVVRELETSGQSPQQAAPLQQSLEADEPPHDEDDIPF